jgi:hypothetical protein
MKKLTTAEWIELLNHEYDYKTSHVDEADAYAVITDEVFKNVTHCRYAFAENIYFTPQLPPKDAVHDEYGVHWRVGNHVYVSVYLGNDEMEVNPSAYGYADPIPREIDIIEAAADWTWAFAGFYRPYPQISVVAVYDIEDNR